ncbi:MAG TPA: ABC transporter permease [Methanomassiliicoccales archaeon]|nr:ABC transporter permease [Methanomassiliicoccales archaeon]
MMEYRSNPIRVFWSSAVLAKRALFAWLSPAMWIMQLFAMSLFQIAFFAYVAVYVNNPEVSVAYVVVGNALQSIAYASIFAVCNITGEEKQQGTLEPILVTPASRFSIFVGRAMFQILNGFATVVIAFVYAAFIFNVDFSQADFVALALVCVVTSFAMTGFGLMISSLGLYLRTSMIVANIFLFVGLLLCGVNFPVAWLPTWIQPISYAIPMTYGTAAARMAVTGSNTFDIGGLLIIEALVGFAAIVVGYLMFHHFEKIARSKGTMERF